MANIPPVHVGDNEIQSIKDNLLPIIQRGETNPDFVVLAWAQCCSYLGAEMQRYFDKDATYRIQWALYNTGERTILGYPGSVNPYSQPSFSSVHPFPYKGVIGLDNRGFHGANGHQYLYGIHFGDGFLCHTEGRDVRPALDDFQEYGYHFDRSWITLMYNKQGFPGHFWGTRGCSPRVTNNYFSFVRSWIEMHIERELKMHLSMGDLNNVPQSELENLYDNVANLIRIYGKEHFLLPGEVNESAFTFSGASSSRIEGLVNRIRQVNPDIPYALTAYGGYSSLERTREYTAPWQQTYYKHGFRDDNFDDWIRHNFSDGYEYYSQIREYGYDHEGIGPGRWVSAAPNKHEINASVMGLLAVSAVLARQSYTYFCSPGIIWDEDFHNMPGFTTVPRLINMLPRGITGGRLHHSGTRWVGTRVFSAVGEFRMDGVLDESTGAGAYVGYGPGDRVKLPINRSFTGQIINPDTLESSSISGRAGESLPEIGYDKGFVLTVQLA